MAIAPAVPQAPPEPVGEDIVLNQIEEFRIEGRQYAPLAMDVPGMMRVVPDKGVTMRRLRRRVRRKRARERDLQTLANILWFEAEEKKTLAAGEGDETSKQKLGEEAQAARDEAIDLLQELYDKKEANHVLTARMLAVAQMRLGEEGRAEEIYSDLVANFPEVEDARPWLIYFHLKNNRQEQAQELAKAWHPDDSELGRLEAYTLAWVKFRAGDYPAAVQAIYTAGRKWAKHSRRQFVHTEAMRFSARAGLDVEAADEFVRDVAGDNPGHRYQVLYMLSREYATAGHYDKAAEVLQLLSSDVLDTVPPKDQVIFPEELALHHIRENHPAETAKFAMAAYQKLGQCGHACDGDQERIIKGLAKYGALLHTIYATSLDERFYSPAKQLYEVYLRIPGREDAETIRGYLNSLEQTKATAAPSQGKHDALTVKSLLNIRLDPFRVCYEKELQANPDLRGKMQVRLEVKQTGEVSGVSTDPGAGAEGLGAVAACIPGLVQPWTLPARTVPGTTTIVIPLSLEPKSAAGS